MPNNDAPMGRPFEKGDIVLHPKFGIGTVIDISDSAFVNGDNAGEQWKVDVKLEGGRDVKVMSSFLRLERDVHRVDDLRIAVNAYGAASVEAMTILMGFGRKLLPALSRYLHRGKHLVYGVPPSGDWRGGDEYADAAYSYYHSGIITLDPVSMGIGVEIPGTGPDDALYVRIVLSLRVLGDAIKLNIGDRDDLTIPVRYTDKDLENCLQPHFRCS